MYDAVGSVSSIVAVPNLSGYTMAIDEQTSLSIADSLVSYGHAAHPSVVGDIYP